MSRILIIGDSAGEGEWGFLCQEHKVVKSVCGCPKKDKSFSFIEEGELYGVTHRGLEKYLLDYGCYVKNYSMGACSNHTALRLLGDTVDAHTFDYIFWFVTDPLRDITHNPNVPLKAKDAIEMEFIIDRYMIRSLERASHLAETKNVKIHIIGGFYSPKLEHIAMFKNIHIACHNLLKLLSTKSLPDDFHGYSTLPWKLQKNKFVDTSQWCLEEGAIDYLESTYNTFLKIMADLPYEYVVNKGEDVGEGRWRDVHVNRVAHKVLFDHLCETFNFTAYNC